MSKMSFIAVCLLPSVILMGCFEEKIKDDPRFRADPKQAAEAMDEGFAVPGAAEVDLVEQMMGLRNAYRASLKNLAEYYQAGGNALKFAWTQREYEMMVQYRYLMPGEIVSADLRAAESIADADKLYQEAMKIYNDAGGLLIIIDEDKLRLALSKFNILIESYPTSDKIDDAAYRAGRIFEHFKDYQIAVVYYQRTFQWDDKTPYPARFRAARTLDRRLLMRQEALPIYKMVLEKESRYQENANYAKRRIKDINEPPLAEFGIEEAKAESSE